MTSIPQADAVTWHAIVRQPPDSRKRLVEQPYAAAGARARAEVSLLHCLSWSIAGRRWPVSAVVEETVAIAAPGNAKEAAAPVWLPDPRARPGAPLVAAVADG